MSNAAPAPQVHLPRDHFGHPGSSIEWWYFASLVRDSSGTPYNVFFTLFSSDGGLVAVSQVVDLKTGRRLGHSEETAFGAVGPSAIAVEAGHARLRLAPAVDAWSFSVATPAYAFAIVAHPTKPYVLHGGGSGVIEQSAVEYMLYHQNNFAQVNLRSILRRSSQIFCPATM